MNDTVLILKNLYTIFTYMYIRGKNNSNKTSASWWSINRSPMHDHSAVYQTILDHIWHIKVLSMYLHALFLYYSSQLHLVSYLSTHILALCLCRPVSWNDGFFTSLWFMSVASLSLCVCVCIPGGLTLLVECLASPLWYVQYLSETTAISASFEFHDKHDSFMQIVVVSCNSL